MSCFFASAQRESLATSNATRGWTQSPTQLTEKSNRPYLYWFLVWKELSKQFIYFSCVKNEVNYKLNSFCTPRWTGRYKYVEIGSCRGIHKNSTQTEPYAWLMSHAAFVFLWKILFGNLSGCILYPPTLIEACKITWVTSSFIRA